LLCYDQEILGLILYIGWVPTAAENRVLPYSFPQFTVYLSLSRHQLSDEAVEDAILLPGFQGRNASLRHRVTVENSNWTLFEFDSPDLAAEAMKFVLQSNVTIHHAHWTSGKSTYKMKPLFNVLSFKGFALFDIHVHRSVIDILGIKFLFFI
jgi:hypothetical protein